MKICPVVPLVPCQAICPVTPAVVAEAGVSVEPSIKVAHCSVPLAFPAVPLPNARTPAERRDIEASAVNVEPLPCAGAQPIAPESIKVSKQLGAEGLVPLLPTPRAR